MLNELIASNVTIPLWETFRCQRPTPNDAHVDDSYYSTEWIISLPRRLFTLHAMLCRIMIDRDTAS